ncbi:acyltransferase [Robertkochia aurantiaca]|uniref:acyltransferase n=1 Tax=Robertkochia aurantiaca TaxID=2873700 RepID=UPI001CCB3E0D|nr:acyltransferase [Robertkochia sp. 3YJGBD-33]
MWRLIGFIFSILEKISKKSLNSYYSHRYKSECKSVGKGVRFNGVSKITGLSNIVLEDNVHIGEGAFIRGEGGLKICENTHIARNVTIYTHNHNYKGAKLPYDDSFTFKSVMIERNVWIGIGVTILPGSKIGEGAIIGAGCIVHGKIPEYAIMGLSGLKKIGERDIEHYKKLDNLKMYGKVDGK